MDLLRGVLPVLPTPFRTGGDIDIRAMKDLVAFALRSGAHGLAFPGFASEVLELSSGERATLLEVVVASVDGKVPVIAGATADSPHEVIQHGSHARSLGLTYLMVQPPGHLGNSSTAVRDFFLEVSDELPDMRFMLQNAPAPRGSDLAPSTIREVAEEIPQIVYVKEETLPAGPAITYLLEHGPKTLLGVIGGGGARYILDEYERGACAAMPALEIADLHVAFDKAWREGRYAEARDIYVRTLPLLTLQAVYRMYLTKYVLTRRGLLQCTDVRAPTPRLDDSAIADIDRNLEELGLLDTRNRQTKIAS